MGYLTIVEGAPCPYGGYYRKIIAIKPTPTALPSYGLTFHLIGLQLNAYYRLNGHYRNLNWRYLPYIRPKFQGISPTEYGHMMLPFSSEISTDSHRHQETPAKSDIISPRSWLVEGQRLLIFIASHVKKKVKRCQNNEPKMQCVASSSDAWELRLLHPAGHELFLCALLALLARDDVVSAFSSDWLAIPTISPDTSCSKMQPQTTGWAPPIIRLYKLVYNPI
jgi:hypothetical protein